MASSKEDSAMQRQGKKPKVDNMPQQTASLIARLPIELWRKIFDHVRHDEGIRDEELWQLRPVETYCYQYHAPLERKLIEIDPHYPQVSSLRAISQTCKIFEAICAPILWDHMTIQVEEIELQERLSFREISLLKQLNIALGRKIVAEQVKTVKFITPEDDGYLISRLKEHNHDHEAVWSENHKYFGGSYPTLAAFQEDLDLLGERLSSCLNLRQFAWEGLFRPWNPFYEKLAQLPKLRHISLGLTKYHMPDSAKSGNKRYPPEPDNWQPFSKCIQIAEIAFGWADTNLLDDAADTGLSSLCPGLFKWFASENQLRHLFIAAPALLYEPDFVPLWAQALTIFVDYSKSFGGAGVGARFDRLEDEFMIAAQRFRSRLVAFEAQASKECSPTEGQSAPTDRQTGWRLTAKDVYHIIKSDPSFEIWLVNFFPTWEDEETQKLMERVVAAKHRGDNFENEEPNALSRQAIALKKEYEEHEPEDDSEWEMWYASPGDMFRLSMLGNH